MKKFLLLTISIILNSILLSNQLAFAGKAGSDCTFDSDCDAGLVCYQEGIKGASGNNPTPIKRCRNRLEVLTQRPSSKPDAKNIQNLPNVTIESGMSLAIKTILRSAMLLTIIAIVVSAIYYITSRGKEEDVTKAKDIILYLVIGMAVMAAAYGIVAGLTRFNVFE